MDFSALMNTMLSGDSITNMSQVTGTSQTEVKDVLSAALPSLLSGAQGQAENASTAAGFANALQDHAKADTSDLASFLSGVDMEDGGKIIGHLLGGNQQSATQEAADKAGLDLGKAGDILAVAGPLLMSLLGQQSTQSQSQSQSNSGLGSLFSNLDIGSLLGNRLGSK